MPPTLGSGSTYLRMMFHKYGYRLGYEPLCAEVLPTWWSSARPAHRSSESSASLAERRHDPKPHKPVTGRWGKVQKHRSKAKKLTDYSNLYGR